MMTMFMTMFLQSRNSYKITRKPKLRTPPEHQADKQRQVVSYKLQDRAARGNQTTNIPLVQARHPRVSRSFW